MTPSPIPRPYVPALRHHVQRNEVLIKRMFAARNLAREGEDRGEWRAG